MSLPLPISYNSHRFSPVGHLTNILKRVHTLLIHIFSVIRTQQISHTYLQRPIWTDPTKSTYELHISEDGRWRTCTLLSSFLVQDVYLATLRRRSRCSVLLHMYQGNLLNRDQWDNYLLLKDNLISLYFLILVLLIKREIYS